MRRGVLIGAGPLLVVGLTLAAALTPGHSQRTDTISSLAAPGEPLRGLVVATLVLYGTLVALGAPTGLVRVHGGATVLVGLVPKVGACTASVANVVHVAAAVVAGAAIVGAMLGFGHRRWGATAALAAIMFRLAWGTDLYGALERVVVLLVVTWLTVVVATSEVADDGGEHLGDRGRVGRVVRRRVGGLGQLAQHAEVGTVAVRDREQSHRA